MTSPAGPLLAFTAVALAAGGLLLVGGLRQSVAAGPGPVDSALAMELSSEPLSLPARTPVAGTPGPGPASMAPAAAFLEDHYGPEADAVRAHLEASGTDLAELDVPLPEQDLLALVPTWLVFAPTERAEARRQRLQWPDELTNHWLTARYGVHVALPPEQLATVELMALQARPGIETAVDGYLDALEAAMLVEYAEGRVRTSPFVAWPLPDPEHAHGSGGFYSLVRVGGGWVVSVGLEERRHPGAIAARQELAGRIHSRDATIREALLALQ